MIIENATDQLDAYANEITNITKDIQSKGYTFEQSIEIIKLALEELKTEDFHHFCSLFYENGITLNLNNPSIQVDLFTND